MITTPYDGPAARDVSDTMADDGDKAVNGHKRQTTIIDVAEMADVAIGTVSRYLNGLSVRRPNRDRIEQAIAALGYRRNAVASAMKTDKTHIIGLLVPAFDEFHSLVLESLARSVRRTSRALLTYCHSNEPRLFRDALEFFGTQRIDALVMDATYIAYDEVDELARQGVPVVFYNNYVSGIAADRVVVENLKASYRAVTHLIDLGHTRVAMLTGDLRDSSARLRLEGYQTALRDRGVAIEPRYAAGPSDWGPVRAYAAMRSLMTLPQPPTAVFTSNYQIAVGALTWLKEQGLKVPDDLSLVSFDDVALFRLHDAGVTAIAQPLARIAEIITDLLVARLSRPDEHVAQTIVLGCDLILRGSTRRLPQAARRPR